MLCADAVRDLVDICGGERRRELRVCGESVTPFVFLGLLRPVLRIVVAAFHRPNSPSSAYARSRICVSPSMFCVLHDPFNVLEIMRSACSAIRRSSAASRCSLIV